MIQSEELKSNECLLDEAASAAIPFFIIITVQQRNSYAERNTCMGKKPIADINADMGGRIALHGKKDEIAKLQCVPLNRFSVIILLKSRTRKRFPKNIFKNIRCKTGTIKAG